MFPSHTTELCEQQDPQLCLLPSRRSIIDSLGQLLAVRCEICRYPQVDGISFCLVLPFSTHLLQPQPLRGWPEAKNESKQASSPGFCISMAKGICCCLSDHWDIPIWPYKVAPEHANEVLSMDVLSPTNDTPPREFNRSILPRVPCPLIINELSTDIAYLVVYFCLWCSPSLPLRIAFPLCMLSLVSTPRAG